MALLRIDVTEEYASKVKAYCKDKRITIKGFITRLIDEYIGPHNFEPAEGKKED